MGSFELTDRRRKVSFEPLGRLFLPFFNPGGSSSKYFRILPAVFKHQYDLMPISFGRKFHFKQPEGSLNHSPVSIIVTSYHSRKERQSTRRGKKSPRPWVISFIQKGAYDGFNL
jgi:hypothetical protein